MRDSSPVTARGTPPETGASTMRTPRAARSAAVLRVSAGSAELISMTSAPEASAAAIPQFSSASATMPPSGSMVTTTLAAAKAPGSPAATAPG